VAKTVTADVLAPIEDIASRIFMIRGERVMIDSDLAGLYQVATKHLNFAVQRNARRFPEDFMFRLTTEEVEILRSQFVTSSLGKHGGRRYLPYAFTEQGVAMLSSVLKSERAADVNVSIMRTFVRLRHALASNEELARKVAQHDHEIGVLFEHVENMLAPSPVKKPSIGFVPRPT
jgi:ORF6N domain